MSNLDISYVFPSLANVFLYSHNGTAVTSQPESSIAPYLTALQERTKALGIRVGSYPLLQHGVYVSLIGQDRVKPISRGGATSRPSFLHPSFSGTL